MKEKKVISSLVKKQRLKLSKNLLEMKFMKRSKEDQAEQDEQEEYRRMFESVQSVVESGVSINYQMDMGAIDRLMFPRRSYGSFNAAVEQVMQQHDDAAAAQLNSAATSQSTKPSVGADDLASSASVDISDAAMAECLGGGGVTDTLRRKFVTKRQHASAVNVSAAKVARKQFMKPPNNDD